MFNYEDLKNLVREVLKEHRSSLNEGGNVFKAPEHGAATIRIKRDDVDPTLKWLEGILGIDLVNRKLGTTGKKETSGDLDIAIDQNKVSKDELTNKLKAWIDQNHPGDNYRNWIHKTGISVHFKTPIKTKEGGDKFNGYVQTDLMFGDPKFMEWAVKGEMGSSEYRGGHRQRLINAIATQRGYAWSPFFGLRDRATKKIISTDPKTVVQTVLGPDHKLILGPDGNPEEFDSIYTLFDIIADKEKYPDDVYEAIREKADFEFPHRDEGEPESLDEAKKDSPRIQHAEDLIFFEGAAGAMRALDALEKMNNPEVRPETSVKWDGSPAVYFGRDKEGNFVFTDKGGFVAKVDKGRANSKEDIEAMYRARSERAADKSDMTAEEIYQQRYSKISAMMQKAFDLIEKSLKPDHRGYFFGEVLYFDKPAVEDGKFVFKPNMVKYKVASDSEMGKKIAKSDVGIVVHSEKDVDEKPILDRLDLKPLAPPAPGIVFFGKTFIEKPVDVDDQEIQTIKNLVETNSSSIDDFFNYEKLRKLTISNLPNIFYAYLNGKVDTGLENLGSDLIDWMEGKKALTSSKKKNITNYIQQNQETYNKIWEIVSRIMKVKDDIIANIDSQGGLEFSQSLGDEEVGEGYVLSDDGKLIKLVDRSKFTRANRSVVREQVDIDDELLDFQDSKTYVFIPGGFKPPHKGHLSLLLKAIEKYPNSKIRIVSGPKKRTAGEKDDEERLEISADQAKQVWKKYINALGISNEVDLDYFEPFKTTGGRMSTSPLVRVGHIVETEIVNPPDPKNADKSAKIVLVSPFQKYADIVARAVDYLNKKFNANLVADPIIVDLIEKEPGIKFSATDMRNSIKNGDFETFATFMPEELSEKDAKEVFAILGGNKDELEEISLAGAVVGYAGSGSPVKRKKRNKRTIYNMRESLNHEESILKDYLVEKYVEKFTNLLSEATDSATATGMTYVTEAFNTTRANFEKRYNGLGEQGQRTSFLVNFLNKMVHGFIQQDIGEGIAPVMPFDELVEKGIITLDIGQSGAQFAQSALEEQEVTLGITDEEEGLDLVPDEEGEAQAEKEQEAAEKMKAGKVSPDVTEEPLPGTNETGNRAASSYYNLDSKNIFRFYNLIGPEDIDDREQFVEFYFKNIVALAAGIERSKTGGELPEPLNSMFNKLSGSGDIVKEPELEDEVAPAQPEGEMTLQEAVTEDDISTIIKQSVIKTFRDLQF